MCAFIVAAESGSGELALARLTGGGLRLAALSPCLLLLF